MSGLPSSADTAPDTEAGLITSHYFHPGKKQVWGLCKVCGLSQAAHAKSRKYVYELEKEHRATLAKRCPNCVIAGVEICDHYKKEDG